MQSKPPENRIAIRVVFPETIGGRGMSPILSDSELINCSLSLATEGDWGFNIGCEISMDCLFSEGNGEVSIS